MVHRTIAHQNNELMPVVKTRRPSLAKKCQRAIQGVFVPLKSKREINQAFKDAVDNYYSNTIRQLLMADDRVDPTTDNFKVMQQAIAMQDDMMIELLLRDPRMNSWTGLSTNELGRPQNEIIIAAQNNNVALLKVFLKNGRLDPSLNNNFALKKSCEHGFLGVVELLVSDTRVNPTSDSHACIRIAAENGNSDVVQWLLADGQVDPAAKGFFLTPLIRERMCNLYDGGYTQGGQYKYVETEQEREETVKMMFPSSNMLFDDNDNEYPDMQDDHKYKSSDVHEEEEEEENNVCPTKSNNYALRAAAANGHFEVVKLLLNDARVTPCNVEFGLACRGGFLGIAQLLATDERVDVTADNNYAFRASCAQGHVHVAEWLSKEHQHVDPSDCNDHAIKAASEQGRVLVVQMLMKDSRVDPSAGNNYSIEWAGVNNFESIVALLMGDSRVRAGLGI